MPLTASSSKMYYLRLKRLTDFHAAGDIIRYTVKNTSEAHADFWAAINSGEFGPVDVLTEKDLDTVEAA